jgi:hypothetical protein
MRTRREQQSVTDADVWWTIDRAALHLGVRRGTVEKYVREGLALHWRNGWYVHRPALLTEYGRRQASTRATRLKKNSAEP